MLTKNAPPINPGRRTDRSDKSLARGMRWKLVVVFKFCAGCEWGNLGPWIKKVNPNKNPIHTSLIHDLGQGRKSNSQLSNAIFAQNLSIEPQDGHTPIHRVHVNCSSTIVRLFE